jgi:hypothetical protein
LIESCLGKGLFTWIVRLVGISELLGAIGLIVPQLTGIAPVLTPIAASGLAFIMVTAAVYHFRRTNTKQSHLIPYCSLFLLRWSPSADSKKTDKNGTCWHSKFAPKGRRRSKLVPSL